MAMREYYGRFWREVRRTVFIFWKAQIGVGLASGVITAILGFIKGLVPVELGLLSVGLVIAGYLSVLGIFFICSVFTAPVTLDSQRRADEDKLSRRVEELTAARKVEPWERAQRHIVVEVLDQFTEEDKAVVRYALLYSPVHFMDTVNHFGDNGPSVMSRLVHAGLFQPVGDHYAVKPAFLLALSHYFHGD